MGLFGKRRDSSQWPTALAKIDEITMDGYAVDFSGAFTVNGEYYTVMERREFHSLSAAEACAASLEQSQTITVHYNPENPADYKIESVPGS